MNAVALRVAARDLLTTTLWYTLGMTIYGLVMVAFFPSIRDAAINFDELIDAYPPAMLEAFGIAEGSDFTSYAVFIGAEYLNVIWVIIAGIFLIMAGTVVVAQEIEKGTAELWLTIPARRGNLLAPKVISLAAAAFIIVLATVLTIGVGAAVVDTEGSVSPAGVMAMGVVLLAFTACVGGYSVLLSTVFSRRSQAAGIAAAITLGSYLCGVVAGLSDSWDWLRYGSIWTAYKPQGALEAGSVPTTGTAVLLVIGILAVAAGFIIFQRRDVIL
jgi:ABC-2 type transport system permease protein